jgi:hypothetical protein
MASLKTKEQADLGQLSLPNHSLRGFERLEGHIFGLREDHRTFRRERLTNPACQRLNS